MRTFSRRNLILLLKYKSSNWNALMTLCFFAANINVYITIVVWVSKLWASSISLDSHEARTCYQHEKLRIQAVAEFRHYIVVLCHSSWISIWRSELCSRSCHNWQWWGCTSLFILQISLCAHMRRKFRDKL